MPRSWFSSNIAPKTNYNKYPFISYGVGYVVAFSADGQDRLSTEHTLTAQGKPSTQQDFPRALHKRQCDADERSGRGCAAPSGKPAAPSGKRSDVQTEPRAVRLACASGAKLLNYFSCLFSSLFPVPFVGLCYNSA